MKPWIIDECALIPDPIEALALFPFVLCKNKADTVTVTHETIHILQQAELFIIGFYIMYAYWLIKGVWVHKDLSIAYSHIPFESEAYAYEEDESYLKKRERFAFMCYLDYELKEE